MRTKQFEKKQCAECPNPFYIDLRTKKRRSTTVYPIRKYNSVTCSRKCSAKRKKRSEKERREKLKLEKLEAINEHYLSNRDDIITQFRKEIDYSELPESDDDLENWYKTELLEIAAEWLEEDKE